MIAMLAIVGLRGDVGASRYGIYYRDAPDILGRTERAVAGLVAKVSSLLLGGALVSGGQLGDEDRVARLRVFLVNGEMDQAFAAISSQHGHGDWRIQQGASSGEEVEGEAC